MEHALAGQRSSPSPEEAAQALAVAEAAAALAGHEITHPEDRALIESVAAGDISSRQAADLLKARMVAERSQ